MKLETVTAYLKLLGIAESRVAERKKTQKELWHRMDLAETDDELEHLEREHHFITLERSCFEQEIEHIHERLRYAGNHVDGAKEIMREFFKDHESPLVIYKLLTNKRTAKNS